MLTIRGSFPSVKGTLDLFPIFTKKRRKAKRPKEEGTPWEKRGKYQ